MPIDLEKIGKVLKQRRESKGLSLLDVSGALCIRKSLIDAMESGNWTLLPHEVYVRGYIKEYSHLLNIKNEISNILMECEEKTERVPVDLPVREVVEPQKRQIPKRAFVYAAVFVLVMGFFVLSQINEEKSPAQLQHTERMSQTVMMNGGSVSNMNAQGPLAEVSSVKKLMITCQERTWVGVVIDDTEKKEFMLNPEDIIVLNAKQSYDLLIGNAGGVRLVLDGKDIDFTGVSGEVKRIKLS